MLYPFSGVIVTAFGGTCNAPWVNHGDSCYLFVTHLKENWSEAVVTYKYFQNKISSPSHEYKNIFKTENIVCHTSKWSTKFQALRCPCSVLKHKKRRRKELSIYYFSMFSLNICQLITAIFVIILAKHFVKWSMRNTLNMSTLRINALISIYIYVEVFKRFADL